MKRLIFGFIIGCLITSCRHRVPPARYEPVHRPGYVYLRVDDGTVLVAASGARELDRALTEVGCGKEYICAIEQSGQIFQVIQRRK